MSDLLPQLIVWLAGTRSRSPCSSSPSFWGSRRPLPNPTALGLGDSTVVNPSGGALAANPVMGAGLIRFGEVANRIMDGSVNRGVAHATLGHLLQQNLVAVLEAN